MDGFRYLNAAIMYHLHGKDTYYSFKYTLCDIYHTLSSNK